MSSSHEFIQVPSLQTSLKYRKESLKLFAFYPSSHKVAIISFLLKSLKLAMSAHMSASTMI